MPSKLKGKTSASSGRFSVMHMDIRGKEVAADRDLAAKRTSENTAMAAQKAYESGYQPHRKSNWVKVTEEPVNPRYDASERVTRACYTNGVSACLLRELHHTTMPCMVSSQLLTLPRRSNQLQSLPDGCYQMRSKRSRPVS